MQPFTADDVTVVPLLSWYDFSFGIPSPRLRDLWMDFHACRWPEFAGEREVAAWFSTAEPPPANLTGGTVISLSHFLPRPELVPEVAPGRPSLLGPVLGSAHLDDRVRALRATIHVYGHSHVPRHWQIGGVTYINNSLGYPHENVFASRGLVCVHET